MSPAPKWGEWGAGDVGAATAAAPEITIEDLK